MRSVLLSLILGACALLCGCEASPKPDAVDVGPSCCKSCCPCLSPAAVAKRASESVVLIRADDKGGAGFFLRDGKVLTCRHVVHDAKDIEVETHCGMHLKAELVYEDEEAELALLDTHCPFLVPLSLRDEQAEPGETVLAIGHPEMMAWTVSRGVVSALDRSVSFGFDMRLTRLIQTDATINPGNSGGPLLDAKGRVVGVVVGYAPQLHGIGWAIHADVCREFLDHAKVVEAMKKI